MGREDHAVETCTVPALQAQADTSYSRSSPDLLRGLKPALKTTKVEEVDQCTGLKPQERPVLRPSRSRTSLLGIFGKSGNERPRSRGDHAAASAPVSKPPNSNPPLPLTRVIHSQYTPTVEEQASTSRIPRTNTTRKKLSKSNNELDTRITPPWDPLPLFQVYPQAIRHTTLETPGPPPNCSQTRKEGSSRPTTPSALRGASESGRSMLGRLKTLRRPKQSSLQSKENNNIADEPFVQRIFALVTTGHLLQYEDKGPSDRLPERVLKLGSESVVFPCRNILGKKWVLQVLQSAHSYAGNPNSSQKSLLSLFTSSSRLMVSSMILIFETEKEMDTWACSIRREIQAAGGQRFSAWKAPSQPVEESDKATMTNRYRVARRTSHSSQHSIPANTQSPPMSPVFASPSTVGNMPNTALSDDHPVNEYANQQLPACQSFQASQSQRLSRMDSSGSQKRKAEITGLPRLSASIEPKKASQESSGLPGLTPKSVNQIAYRQARPSNVNVIRRGSLQGPPKSPVEEFMVGPDQQLSLRRNQTHDSTNRSHQLRSHQPKSIATGYRSWSLHNPSSPASSSFPASPVLQTLVASSSPTMDSISEATPKAKDFLQSKEDTQTESRQEPIYPEMKARGEASPLENIKEDVTTPRASETAIRSKTPEQDSPIEPTRSEDEKAGKQTPEKLPEALPFRPAASRCPSAPSHSSRSSLTTRASTSSSANSSSNPSRRTSILVSSSPLPLRTSMMHQQKDSLAENSPPHSPVMGTKPSTETKQPLRRPASMQIRSDKAPFTSSMSVSSSARSSNAGTPVASRRTSTQVPIVRPATIKSRKSASIINSGMAMASQLPSAAPQALPQGLAA